MVFFRNIFVFGCFIIGVPIAQCQDSLGRYSNFTGAVINSIGNDSEGRFYCVGSDQVWGLHHGDIYNFNLDSIGLSKEYPKVYARINASLPLKNAGWIIGGLYGGINDSIFHGLAKIYPNGSFKNVPVPFGGHNEVECIAEDKNGNYYLGGDFSIKNKPLLNFVKIDSAGKVIGPSYFFNGTVQAVALDDFDNVYVAGHFTEVNGVKISSLVRIKPNGVIDDFDAKFNGAVNKIVFDKLGNICVGGQFTQVNDSVVRNYFAKIDTSGKVLNYDIGINNIAFDFKIDSKNNLVISGAYSKVKDTINVNNKLSIFDINAKFMSHLDTFKMDGKLILIDSFDNLYVTGILNKRNKYYYDIIRIDSNYKVEELNTGLYYSVSSITKGHNSLLISSGSIYKAENRYSITKFNQDGKLDSFNAMCNKSVECIETDNLGNVYIGGRFTIVNGVSQLNFAKFNKHGELLNFKLSVTLGTIYDIKVTKNGNIIVGGNFSFNTQNGVQSGLAIFDSKGNLLPKYIHVDGSVNQIEIDKSNNIYIAGDIRKVNSKSVPSIAKLDQNLNQLPFGPNLEYVKIYEMLLDDNDDVYIGGTFKKSFGFLEKYDSKGVAQNLNFGRNAFTRIERDGITKDELNNIYVATSAQIYKIDTFKNISLFYDFKPSNPSINSFVNRISFDKLGRLHVLGFMNHPVGNYQIINLCDTINIKYQPKNIKICEKDSFIVRVEVEKDSINYQWFKNGQILDGENGDSLFVYNANSSNAGDYYCLVSNRCLVNKSKTIKVEVLEPQYQYDTFNECEPIKWLDGVVYDRDTTGITFKHSVKANNGCDSIAHLTLIINEKSYFTDSVISCDSFTWINGETYYESVDTPSFNLKNTNGCDSLVHLSLKINKSSYYVDTVYSCDSFEWVDGRKYGESTNSPTFKYQNFVGCDSIIQLNLEINLMDKEIHQNGNLLYSIDSSHSYQWLDCKTGLPLVGEDSNKLIIKSDGTFALVLFDSLCIDTSDCISVRKTELNDFGGFFELYPNPNYGVFSIMLDKEYNSIQVIARNVLSQCVLNKKFENKSNVEINLNDVKGVFYIELVLNDEARYIKKILVE